MARKTQTPLSPRQHEFDTKLRQIRDVLAEKKLAGVAFSTQALFAWASAGGDNHVVLASDGGVATLLVTPDRVTVLANNIEIERLRIEEFDGLDQSGIEFWTCPWHGESCVETELQRRMGAHAWASDSGGAPVRVGEDFLKLTYALTETEIERYRKLGKDCSIAMEEALGDVRPGCTEQRIGGLICQRLCDHGVRPHVILIATDERAFQFRHPIPKGKKLRKHLMAVLCGKRHGLITSLTRMVYFGKKLPGELRRKHDAVCAVDVAFNHATVPADSVSEVFAEGVAEYERQGFADEWKLHHQGGPAGYQGRSYIGKPSERRPVLLNQAFAWNPSITGTKSEDTILTTSAGIEFLSSPTRAWPAKAIKLGGKTYRRADFLLV